MNKHPFTKGRCVWTKGPCCRVYINVDDAATYEYTASHNGDVECSFTLLSEVGEPYLPLFEGFFKHYEITGVVDYGREWPFVADLVKRKEGCASETCCKS